MRVGPLINLAAMQLAWFACVLGAAHGVGWVGTATTALVVALHLASAARPQVEIKLIAAALLIGLVLDSALSTAGAIAFASDVWFAGMTTHWMLALWAGFATALTSSLSWLLARPPLAVAFGAVGGPIAYAAGAKLDALTLAGPTSFVFIGTGWAIAMVLFVKLTRHAGASRPREVLV